MRVRRGWASGCAGNLRAVHAGVERWAIPVSVEGQLLGLADRDSDDYGHVRHRRGAYGVEGSVCAAARGERDREDSGGVGVAADAWGCDWQGGGAETSNREQVAAFLRERLHFYLKDVRGFAYDVVAAVLAADANDVRDAIARAEALTAVRGSEDFAAVSAAFKRIKNILRQAEEKGFALGSVTM